MRLDSSHWLKVGDSLLNLIVTIPGKAVKNPVVFGGIYSIDGMAGCKRC